MAIITNQYFVLFAVVGLGLLIGRIPFFGIRFGNSAVLFVALAAGHFHLTFPAGAGSLGLILFMYCLGITAGPSFFGTLASRGTTIAKVAVMVIVSAAGITLVLARVFDVPRDIITGMFAGALTSTPALAAGLDALQGQGLVSVGYGIAYPFGVIGVVLFVQVLPRLLKTDLDKLGETLEAEQPDTPEVAKLLVRVTNPSVVGKDIAGSAFLDEVQCRVSRHLQDNLLVPIAYGAVFETGQVLLLVGRKDKLSLAIEHLGEKAEGGMIDSLREETADVVITDKTMTGKPLADVKTLQEFGVTITRITRNGVMFVPSSRDTLEHQDMVKIVGDAPAIAAFTKACGHSARAMHETDLLSLAIGVVCGVAIGLIPVSLGAVQFKLGLAGGPLLSGLLLGHFGRIGSVVGRIPYGSRTLMMDLGISLFLANAGIKAGALFGPTVAQHGPGLFALGAVITIFPLAVGYVLARYVARLNMLAALGSICGAMTSTPALGSLKSQTKSQIPVISYATAYPLALILMVIFTQLMVRLLG